MSTRSASPPLVRPAGPPLASGPAHALSGVVSVGLVGLGHLVDVLFPRDRGARAVEGVDELLRQAHRHRLPLLLARVVDDPAYRQRLLARLLDLARHLVV